MSPSFCLQEVLALARRRGIIRAWLIGELASGEWQESRTSRDHVISLAAGELEAFGSGALRRHGRHAREVDADHLQAPVQSIEGKGVCFLHRVVEHRVV